MPWAILLIALVVIGVVVVANVFRSAAEEERERERRRAGRPGRPVTDLDRFLDEARRRRDEGDRRRRPAPRPDAIEVDRPPSRRALVQPPPLRSATRPVARPGVPFPAAAGPAFATPPGPPPRSSSSPAPIVLKPADEEPILNALPVASAPPSGTPTGTGRSATVAQAFTLLRSPQAAGAAWLLREILDEPRCRRSLRPVLPAR
jgi:hypothetical protein